MQKRNIIRGKWITVLYMLKADAIWALSMIRMLAIYFQNEIFVFLIKTKRRIRRAFFTIFFFFELKWKLSKSLSSDSSHNYLLPLLWVTGSVHSSSSDVSGMMYQKFGCFLGTRNHFCCCLIWWFFMCQNFENSSNMFARKIWWWIPNFGYLHDPSLKENLCSFCFERPWPLKEELRI